MVWPNATHIDPYHPYFLCAYDILDLPRHAKSPLSIVASRSDYLSLPLLFYSPFPHALIWTAPYHTTHLRAQRPHYLDTLCELCQSVNQPACRLRVTINRLRPTGRGCGITSPGKGHRLSAQKWISQHIQVPGEPRCNYLILF